MPEVDRQPRFGRLLDLVANQAAERPVLVV
jgi:hypothetical protein